ncbi:phosphoribosyltransferase [Dyadobacter flavalbus]|nr:phosphoribosyltransferase family protein [Dyadobacter flavalbus]
MKRTKTGIVFRDRKDAGEKLGMYLEAEYKRFDPLVLGIPRGGMEVAYYVAKHMKAPLSMLISKKLPYPNNKEVGFGAIAEDLSVYIAANLRKTPDREIIGQVIDEQTDEINRRIKAYRKGGSFPDVTGRTVILVDDGIATGVTLVPALRLCKNKGALKIVVAVPVCGPNYDKHLNEADGFEVMVQPKDFYAVGQVYESFYDLSEDEFMSILERGSII